MTIVRGFGLGDVGFSGNSCAEFGRAITVHRWDTYVGERDSWSIVVCDTDLLPQAGSSFNFQLRNAATGETGDYNAQVLQMDSYRTYRPTTQFEQLLSLSVPDAVAISAAVMLAWATAYAVKLVMRALSTDEVNHEEDR